MDWEAATYRALFAVAWTLVAAPAYALAVLLIFGDPDRDGR